MEMRDWRMAPPPEQLPDSGEGESSVEELVPIVSGFAVGLALGALRPSLRLPIGAALAVVLGVLATVVTGEFRTSWAFVLIDIPLVAITAVSGLALARQATGRTLRSG
jgi:hypothetical protein